MICATRARKIRSSKPITHVNASMVNFSTRKRVHARTVTNHVKLVLVWTSAALVRLDLNLENLYAYNVNRMNTFLAMNVRLVEKIASVAIQDLISA